MYSNKKLALAFYICGLISFLCYLGFDIFASIFVDPLSCLNIIIIGFAIFIAIDGIVKLYGDKGNFELKYAAVLMMAFSASQLFSTILSLSSCLKYRQYNSLYIYSILFVFFVVILALLIIFNTKSFSVKANAITSIVCTSLLVLYFSFFLIMYLSSLLVFYSLLLSVSMLMSLAVSILALIIFINYLSNYKDKGIKNFDLVKTSKIYNKPLYNKIDKHDENPEEKLIKLKELKDAGIITDEEFNEKKKKYVDML